MELFPGVTYWPEKLDRDAQQELLTEVLTKAGQAPFFRPAMPRTGTPFSVEMTNFGPLGWVSDRDGGYRYQAHHPVTAARWPEIPDVLLNLWAGTTGYMVPPEACLVNLYRAGAHMGLHRDEDEQAMDAPVLSVSLGDAAIFRFGMTKRGGGTKTIRLRSGDVLSFGGPARLLYHGIDRIEAGSSGLVPGGGRINLTLRRVTPK